MAFAEWTMKGAEFANCNCVIGCPCQFNALPSHGHCRAMTFVEIESGRFNDVPLDGLRWGIFGAWPGPIHKGGGTFQALIDARATAAQRAALEAIALGRETEPGKLVWQVFSTTVTTVLPTKFVPIDLHIDVAGRMAALHVPGVIDAEAAPIRNPVTGAPHRASVTLPEGFEYTTAEFASGKTNAPGAVELKFDNTHAHLAHIHWSTHGVVR